MRKTTKTCRKGSRKNKTLKRNKRGGGFFSWIKKKLQRPFWTRTTTTDAHRTQATTKQAPNQAHSDDGEEDQFLYQRMGGGRRKHKTTQKTKK